ncbi:MAG: YwiC-like family protein [Candidatus Sulfobium sp.]
MKRYILKEYGSWGVAVLSYLTGLSAGGRFSPGAAAVFAALVLYVNSKQALTLWLRGKGPDSGKYIAVFLVQIGTGTLLIVSVAWHTFPAVLPFLIIPAAYLLLFLLKGEHFILTEIAGFFLLAVAAPFAELPASGSVDVTLYMAVALFFTAGVFRVRMQFTRQNTYRILMVAYLVLAASIYQFLALPLIALAPLTDNLVCAATLYKVRLRTAGRLELGKGLMFVVLMTVAYAGH